MSERTIKGYEYLGQRVARKFPEVGDYALNEYAEQLAYLRFLFDIDPENDTIADIIGKYYQHVGMARAVKRLDNFTQLALKAGTSKIKVKAV